MQQVLRMPGLSGAKRPAKWHKLSHRLTKLPDKFEIVSFCQEGKQLKGVN